MEESGCGNKALPQSYIYSIWYPSIKYETNSAIIGTKARKKKYKLQDKNDNLKQENGVFHLEERSELITSAFSVRPWCVLYRTRFMKTDPTSDVTFED